MTLDQTLWDLAAATAAIAFVAVAVEPWLGRRYELVAERGLRLVRRGRRRFARRAAGYALMAAEELTRRRSADTNGHHDPGPDYPLPELEAIAEMEMRREAKGE